MKARVTVTLKSGILDPQGKAIEGALKSLGVDGVASVRQGKVFDIEMSGADKAKAEAALKDAADKLLGEYRDRELSGRIAGLGMSEISMQQVYALALDVSCALDRIDNSVDKLLADMRVHNLEMATTAELIHELSRQMKALT